MKKVIVLSLGGSLIIPDDINVKLLKEFKRVVLKNKKNWKFIIVCGGGSIARKYISALAKEGIGERFQSYSGISATITNARFVGHFFNHNSNDGVPTTIKRVKKDLSEMDIVFCGALEYRERQTSDSTAAEIAKELGCIFINLTNVPGLYNKNPKENKDAKFIENVTWKEFHKMAMKIRFKPGLHFVLDAEAAGIIMKHKIKTYIIGSNMKNLDNFLNNKKFRGTRIEG